MGLCATPHGHSGTGPGSLNNFSQFIYVAFFFGQEGIFSDQTLENSEASRIFGEIKAGRTPTQCVDGGIAGDVAGWREENTNAGRSAKLVLGGVEVEYIYSFARLASIIFTCLNL
jgi:hypothetical protein